MFNWLCHNSSLAHRCRLGEVESIPLHSLQRGDERIMDTLTTQFERTLILQALQHSNGRREEASILLGIGRNTLTRKIQSLGL
jgi:two-component system nitrogen regulation response regulator GlnG